MARPSLGKPQKALVAIIETEGAAILSVRKDGPHIEVDYTFDQQRVFTQRLPHGKFTDPRWSRNFRSAVRNTKRQLET